MSFSESQCQCLKKKENSVASKEPVLCFCELSTENQRNDWSMERKPRKSKQWKHVLPYLNIRRLSKTSLINVILIFIKYIFIVNVFAPFPQPLLPFVTLDVFTSVFKSYTNTQFYLYEIYIDLRTINKRNILHLCFRGWLNFFSRNIISCTHFLQTS